MGEVIKLIQEWLCKSTHRSAVSHTEVVQGDVQRDENKTFNSAIMLPIHKKM